jgi:hypothetical protein
MASAAVDKAGVQNAQPEIATSRAAGTLTANAGKSESGPSSSKIATSASSADTQTVTQSAEADPSDAANAVTEATPNSFSAAAAMILPLNLALPGVEVVPGVADQNPLAVKAAQTGKAPDATLAKPPDAVTGSSQKSTSAPLAGTAGPGASSNTFTGSNQASHQPQADGSQTAPGNSGTNPGASQTAMQINGQIHAQIDAQTQQAASHGAVHDIAASHSAAGSVADAVRAGNQASQAEGAENAGVSPINTANVIQKMSETEMHVGMRSADFGEVSIRTLVSQQQMTAQISVDHGDLGKAISAHIPAMEAKLGGDFGLRAIVEVNQSGMSFSGERGFSSQREQRSFAQPAQSQDAAPSLEADLPALSGVARTGDPYRLDIRA